MYSPDKKSAKEEAKGGEAEINNSGFFEPAKVNHYNWSQEYTSEQYTKLLNTYANYQNLDDKVREAFFKNVREVIDSKLNGKITNHYLAVLYTAKKV
jgi:predicted AlkP superfamily phosphohydrolase/phosphomutase